MANTLLDKRIFKNGAPVPNDPFHFGLVFIDFDESFEKRLQQYDDHYFPRKIVIQHQDMKVRLIVTQWTVS